MTPDEINAIKGRLADLGKGNRYQRLDAQDLFFQHAEGDVKALLDEVERLQSLLQNARLMLPVNTEADSRRLK